MILIFRKGNLKEDSFEFEDINFYNTFPISQISKTCTPSPTKNGHDLLFEPTFAMSKEPGEFKTTFSHKENNENLENDNDVEQT